MFEKIDRNPYRIYEGELPGKGRFGVGICPGHSARLDIGARCEIRLAGRQGLGAALIVTLLTEPEFEILGVPDFEMRVRETGIRWYHFPIEDGVPKTYELDLFRQIINCIVKEIEKVFIHCRGGIGRSGTVVCQSLKQMGYTPKQGLSLIRTWRHGAVENKLQEDLYLILASRCNHEF